MSKRGTIKRESHLTPPDTLLAYCVERMTMRSKFMEDLIIHGGILSFMEGSDPLWRDLIIHEHLMLPTIISSLWSLGNTSLSWILAVFQTYRQSMHCTLDS